MIVLMLLIVVQCMHVTVDMFSRHFAICAIYDDFSEFGQLHLVLSSLTKLFFKHFGAFSVLEVRDEGIPISNVVLEDFELVLRDLLDDIFLALL